jgi:hypothetical protein
VADVRTQQLHRDLIRHELAATGKFDEFFPDGRASIERTEDIAHRKMEEARDGAEDFALGALAAAGSAEK